MDQLEEAHAPADNSAMPRTVTRGRRNDAAAMPQWIAPQLTQLVDAAPDGGGWLHEIKYDGYRMMARLDHGAVKLLTRTGLDWTHKYPAIAKAVASLGARQAYLDGELCGVGADGLTHFNIVQAASDAGNAAALAFYLFDLLHLDGEDLTARPVLERKQRLAALLPANGSPLHYSDHVIGQGPSFYAQACQLAVEGIVSKNIGAPYAPGNRGLWRKVKCLNGEEFVVVGCGGRGSRRFPSGVSLPRLRRVWAALYRAPRDGAVPFSPARGDVSALRVTVADAGNRPSSSARPSRGQA